MSKIHEIDLSISSSSSCCLDVDFDDGRDDDSKSEDDNKRRKEDDYRVDLTKDSILKQFIDILYFQLYLPKYHKKNKKRKNCLSKEDFIHQLFSSSLMVDKKINERKEEENEEEKDLDDVIGDIILFIQPFPFFLYIHCLPLMFHLTRFFLVILFIVFYFVGEIEQRNF